MGGGISINGGQYVAAIANQSSTAFGTGQIGTGSNLALGANTTGAITVFAADSGGSVAAQGTLNFIPDDSPDWVAYFQTHGQPVDPGSLGGGTLNAVLRDGSSGVYYPGHAISSTPGAVNATFYNQGSTIFKVTQP